MFRYNRRKDQESLRLPHYQTHQHRPERLIDYHSMLLRSASHLQCNRGLHPKRFVPNHLSPEAPHWADQVANASSSWDISIYPQQILVYAETCHVDNHAAEANPANLHDCHPSFGELLHRPERTLCSDSVRHNYASKHQSSTRPLELQLNCWFQPQHYCSLSINHQQLPHSPKINLRPQSCAWKANLALLANCDYSRTSSP